MLKYYKRKKDLPMLIDARVIAAEWLQTAERPEYTDAKKWYAQKQMEEHNCDWAHGNSRIASTRDIENALKVLEMFKDNHSIKID